MIIRKTLVLVALGFSFLLNAQDVHNWFRYRSIINPSTKIKFPVEPNKLSAYLLERDITYLRVSQAEINTRGKAKYSRYSYRYSFDNKGMVSYLETYKKGKKIRSTAFTYDGDNVASKITMNKKMEFVSSEFFRTTPHSREQEYVLLKKGDTTLRLVVGPIVNNQSTDEYYKNGKLKYYWVNTYYPNQSLKQSSFYTKKDKVKYTWDYQCKEEGVEIKKQKDTTTQCQEKSTNAEGITTLIQHTVNEKGETYQTIQKINRVGKYFYYKQTSGPQATLQWETLTTYLDDDTTKVAFTSTRYKKGLLAYQYHNTYDENGNETSRKYTTYKKGEIESEFITTYTYDDRNRPIKRESNDVLSSKKKVVYYDYSFDLY